MRAWISVNCKFPFAVAASSCLLQAVLVARVKGHQQTIRAHMQVRATLAVYEVEESSANTVTLLQSLTLVPPSFCLVAVAKDKEK